MDEMATNTEYILKMVLELAEKCKTLEESKATIEKLLTEKA